MKQTQQVALFDLGTATKQASINGKSVRLFSSTKSDDLSALKIKTMSQIRTDLKAQGLKGNELSNGVRTLFFEGLGVASVRGKSVEAAFEELGAKVTGQRLSVSTAGTVRLTSVRSKWAPTTLEGKAAQLAARIKRDNLELKALLADKNAIKV